MSAGDKQLTMDELIRLREELHALDNETIEIEGKPFRPSQCYRFETDPAHILFNTNCPESLREKVQSILSKYTREDEGRS